MHKRLLGKGGPLGVFYEYPILLRLAGISVCAEIGWATLIVVLQYHFMNDLLKNEAQQFIASRVATATLAFTACETVFKVPMGSLSDRFGSRPMIFFALTVATISPLLMMLATQWYHFIPLRALDGLGAAALWPAMSSLMARSVPREAKAAAMSVFNGAYCLGLAIGPLAGLYLGHRFGNGNVFPLCSVFMVLGILIARTVLHSGIGDKVQAVSAPKPHLIGEGFPSHEGSLLRGRPMLLRMMILYALSQTAVGMLASVIFIYLDKQFGIEEGDLPRLIALPAIGVAFLALPLGRLADSIGRPRAVWISYVLATTGMLLVAVTSLMNPTTSLLSPPLLTFGLGMMFLIGSFILGTPAWLGLTSVQVPDTRQAQALSLMQTAQGVGVVIGLGLVAFAGHLLTGWKSQVHKLQDRLHHNVPQSPVDMPALSTDVVPLSVWLWAAAVVFALCLIGTLLFVREPPHSLHAEEEAARDKQPLEITGI